MPFHRTGPIARALARLSRPIAVFALAFTPVMLGRSAAAEDAQAALQKANTYIELAKTTERAVESWERYLSWVNMKTGPTGKERYISYGLYSLHDAQGQLQEARTAMAAEPRAGKLDQQMARYIDAYEALAPVMNAASAYYDSNAYEQDKAAEGRVLHKKMVPLATSFLAEREAMMPQLRAFVLDVEHQELVDIEAREGRTAAWHAGQVFYAADRIFELFPRNRPQPMDSETLEAEMQALGPDTSPEKFEQVMAGVVPPKDTVIDVQRYGEALKAYAEAVGVFERFKGEKPEGFDDLKPLPRKLLTVLQAFEGPLKKSKGREFEGSGQMAGRIVEAYFEMLNEGGSIRGSQLRYLP